MSDKKSIRMSAKDKLVIFRDKWMPIEAILGAIWGILSFFAWLLLAGGSTSSANPPLTFIVLTLPASIPILLSYYFIDIPVTVMIILIPIAGAIIVTFTVYTWKKRKNE